MNQLLVLASNSPRRKEIMEMLPWDFTVDAKDTEEVFDPAKTLDENLMELAYQKAKVVAGNHEDQVIIGGDTIVLVDGEVLGKPKDEADAKRMLHLISHDVHYVCTGVCILHEKSGTNIQFVEKTAIHMTPMSQSEIDEYVNTGEPFGKAGSYAIQGKGGVYVEGIHGDYYNVVGLPLNRLYKELKSLYQR